MQEQKEPLSESTGALLTILSAAAILLGFASGSNILAFLAIVSIIVIKYYAVENYGRKLDKFYLFMFSWAALMLIVLEILYRI
jgi:asparagine N-glycosylation enzyme membrane subunit Stt3